MTQPAIRGFTGQWRWLSNFWPAEVRLDGVPHATVEHAYQAAKTCSPCERQMIRDCQTPGQTKRMARRVTFEPIGTT